MSRHNAFLTSVAYVDVVRKKASNARHSGRPVPGLASPAGAPVPCRATGQNLLQGLVGRNQREDRRVSQGNTCRTQDPLSVVKLLAKKCV